MWVVHWGLLPRLPWRTWVCPCEGQVWRWWAARVAGVLAAPGAQESWQLGQQEIQCSRRIWQPVLANTLQYSCLENPHPHPGQRSLAVYRSQRVGHYQSNAAHIDARHFLPVAALPQWGLSVKVAHLLGLWGPWRCQVCRDMDCLHHRSYGPIRVVYRASCSWWSEGLSGQSFSVAPPVQALEGSLAWGPSLLFTESGTHRGPLTGVLLCRWACQSLKGAPCIGPNSVVQCVRCLMSQPLYCSAADAVVLGEGGYGDGSTPLHVTQQYHLASMAAWLSSTGISHHDLCPHIPSIHLSTVNSSPHPRIAPQSQTPAPSHCTFQGTCIPVQGMYGRSQDCLILIPFRLPQISCFTQP